jgi:hypothetical protein
MTTVTNTLRFRAHVMTLRAIVTRPDLGILRLVTLGDAEETFVYSHSIVPGGFDVMS